MRFLRQVQALARKNVLLQRRNGTATATQLLIGVFFLVLLMVMNVGVKAAQSRNQFSIYTVEPNTVDASTFAHCSNGAGAAGSCYDVVWSPQRDVRNATALAKLRAVMAKACAALGTAPEAVLELGNKTVMDAWLLEHPNRTRAAVYFGNAEQWARDVPAADFSYVVRYNTTKTCAALGVWGCDNPQAQVAIPLQAALDSALASLFSVQGGGADFEIKVRLSDFAHPDMPNTFDVVAAYGPTFLYIAASFNYVIQMLLIVEEKELHLTEAMYQMGLSAGANWVAWLGTNAAINTAMVALLYAFGQALGLDLFRETSPALLLSFFWVSSMGFTSMGFLLSTLTNRSATARLLGVGIFIFSFVVAPIVVSGVLSNGSEIYDGARVVLSLFPIFGFYFVLTRLISASSGVLRTGMTWDGRLDNLLPSDPTNAKGDSVWTVDNSLRSLVLGFLLMSALAWYLERVLPTEHGHREPLLFFLQPSYWLPGLKARAAQGTGARRRSGRVAPSADDADADEDVKVEAAALRQGEFAGRDVAVRLLGLSKLFYGGGVVGRFFTPPFRAVRCVEYAIENNSTFVLLGHNGAGKSTTISMLSGLSDCTDGDATIFGLSVVNEMHRIRELMGVCPQHDVLFAALTGRESLRLFATIKGVPADKVEAEVQRRLEQTLLTDAADRACGSYSGGMKRRLSIAIALIGDPKIVFLDEPTTGMDPITRRDVWSMISEAKKGRVIFLTTHSMEEADVLGDRIGVMAEGRMQALGTSLRLKTKFGSGYHLSALLPEAAAAREARVAAISAFVKEHGVPGTSEPRLQNLGSTLTVALPKLQGDAAPYVSFFRAWEQRQDSLGEFSLSQSTLEEVFINLSEANHAKHAAAMAHTPPLQPPPPQQQQQQQQQQRPLSRVGFNAQFRALFFKSYRYQCTQRSSCCMIVAFPVLVMLMLMGVEKAALDPLRVLALCGANISKAECAVKGYNLDCVGQLLQQTRPAVPTPVVGQISNSGRYGGINQNCNKLGCFTGLEQPDWRGVPLHMPDNGNGNVSGSGSGSGSAAVTTTVAANTNQVSAARMLEWSADMSFLLLNGTCTQAYSEAFDSAVQCKDLAMADKKACQDRVAALASAKAYLEQGLLGAGVVSASSLLSICQPTAGTNGTATFAAPEARLIDAVRALQDALAGCLVGQAADVVQLLVPAQDGWYVKDAIGNATAQRSGFLREYSTAMFGTTATQQLANMLTTLSGVGRGSSLGQLCRGAGVLGNATRALELLLAQRGDSGADAARKAAQATDAMCAWALDPDAVRGVSFNSSYASQLALLQDGLLARWYGEQLQTPLMRERAPRLKDASRYQERSFLAHWQAYDFEQADEAARKFRYTAFYNNSGTGGRQSGNWEALVWAVDAAIVRAATGWGVQVATEAIPTKFKCNRDAWLNGTDKTLDCAALLPRILSISLLDLVATELFPYLLMTLMFVIVSLIVYEKENRLRVIMKMMGLDLRVYWLVTYLFYIAQYALMVLIMVKMGAAANLGIFAVHSPGVTALFLASWGNLLVLYSFFLSLFFKSSRTSTAAVFLLMLILNTTGSSLLQSLTEDPNTPESAFTLIMLFSPMLMIRAVLWLGISAAFREQVTFDNWGTYGGGAVKTCITYMWAHIVLLALLVWYLDNVLAVGFGVARPLNFFLKKEYWTGPARRAPGADDAARDSELLRAIPHHGSVRAGDIPEDAAREHERTVRGEPAPDGAKPVLRIVRMAKEFGGMHAVRSVSLTVSERECFAMLGHNGAGKTTLLSMLTGLIEPSHGAARVCGFDVRSEMHRIYPLMGICPQHDILWATLSGRDHLNFYGRLKGLKGAELSRSVEQALRDVNLLEFQHRAAGRYSGGMKRRLSTAIAIIGSPQVVYLDEPSTGLDPASRKQLWNVINNAKKGKSIVLTTHSMEEAELLGDRVGIMAGGLFQTLGVPAALKKRFGAGYTLTVMTRDRADEAHARILAFVAKNLPAASLRNAQLGGASSFVVPAAACKISDVFELFTKHKDEQAIIDWSISEATLEEVFLFLAEQAHAKTTEGEPHRRGRGEFAALDFLRRGSIALGKTKVAPQTPVVPE